MNNNCKYHGWQDTDNEPCPYCIIDQLRADLDWTVAALGLMTIERDQLRKEKAELYQMLKAIVDTRIAGYAFLDMTKPQALLDRLEVDQ